MVKLYFDGSITGGNPSGTARYGFVIYLNNEVVKEESGLVGTGEGMTNNVAEYHGLLNGIRCVIQGFPRESLEIYGDSQLVINQLLRKFACNKDHLRELRDKCLVLLEGRQWSARWVRREDNTKADELSKRSW